MEEVVVSTLGQLCLPVVDWSGWGLEIAAVPSRGLDSLDQIVSYHCPRKKWGAGSLHFSMVVSLRLFASLLEEA